MQGSFTGSVNDVLLLTNSAPPHLHGPDVASARTVGPAPGPTVRATAVSPATTARSATVAAPLATTATAAGKSAPTAGTANPATTKRGSAGAVSPDGREPGVFRAGYLIRTSDRNKIRFIFPAALVETVDDHV